MIKTTVCSEFWVSVKCYLFGYWPTKMVHIFNGSISCRKENIFFGIYLYHIGDITHTHTHTHTHTNTHTGVVIVTWLMYCLSQSLKRDMTLFDGNKKEEIVHFYVRLVLMTIVIVSRWNASSFQIWCTIVIYSMNTWHYRWQLYVYLILQAPVIVTKTALWMDSLCVPMIEV